MVTIETTFGTVEFDNVWVATLAWPYCDGFCTVVGIDYDEVSETVDRIRRDEATDVYNGNEETDTRSVDEIADEIEIYGIDLESVDSVGLDDAELHEIAEQNYVVV